METNPLGCQKGEDEVKLEAAHRHYFQVEKGLWGMGISYAFTSKVSIVDQYFDRSISTARDGGPPRRFAVIMSFWRYRFWLF